MPTSSWQEPDPIKHVVLLMLENHSFDQMLGCFQQLPGYEKLEGVTKADETIRFNVDPDGRRYFQIQTEELQMEPDPRHENNMVLEQIKDNNSGFVRNFVLNAGTSTTEAIQNVMGYYPLGFLPALHALARDFTICDHWFSSLPGSTWPNRYFALSGTSSGRVNMPRGLDHPEDAKEFFQQNQETIFDRLLDAQRSYLVYYYDFPSSLLLNHQRQLRHLQNYRLVDRFFKDVQDEATFPDFCFIEPKYFGTDENDDHPPHNIMKAEKLIADVYNAIRSNDPLWDSSLLVVLFDEHGGFYDHLPPPAAVPPDDHKEEYTFDRLGVRVPALLISPWVQRGFIDTAFDHTSLLRYMIDKWGLQELTERSRRANTVASAISAVRREETDTVPFIRVPYTQLIPPNPALEKTTTSSLHKSLEAFVHHLSAESSKVEDKAAADAIEALAKEAGRIEKARTGLGKWLIAIGSKLTGAAEARERKRIDLITQTILKHITQPADQ